MIRTTFLAVAALLLCAGAAHAEYHDLTEPVAGHTGVTYFDLLKDNIVPDLKLDGQQGVGTKAIAVPYVLDLGDSDEDPTVGDTEFTIYSVEVLPIEAGGKQWSMMLTDLGGADGWAAHYEVLALFDENLEMSDAINVGLDQMTGLRDDLVRVSASDQAVVTYSEHFNSSQTYGALALLMVQDGKFVTIGTFDLLSDRWCGHVREQALRVTSEDAGAGYWPITVTVSDKLALPAEDLENGGCGEDAGLEEPFETTYRATYSWSASMGQYITESDAFDKLADVNSDRY